MCKLRCKVQQETQYHVQTALGVSERSYSNNNSPIHGSGQGGTLSGTEWAFINITLMKTLETTTKGCLVSNQI